MFQPTNMTRKEILKAASKAAHYMGEVLKSYKGYTLEAILQDCEEYNKPTVVICWRLYTEKTLQEII